MSTENTPINDVDGKAVILNGVYKNLRGNLAIITNLPREGKTTFSGECIDEQGVMGRRSILLTPSDISKMTFVGMASTKYGVHGIVLA